MSRITEHTIRSSGITFSLQARLIKERQILSVSAKTDFFEGVRASFVKRIYHVNPSPFTHFLNKQVFGRILNRHHSYNLPQYLLCVHTQNSTYNTSDLSSEKIRRMLSDSKELLKDFVPLIRSNRSKLRNTLYEINRMILKKPKPKCSQTNQ